MNNQTSSDIDEEMGWSRTVAKQMLKSVRIARGLNKNSWAIMNVEQGAHLNVGQRNAIEMNDRHVILLVDCKYSPTDAVGTGSRVLEWRDENIDKFPRLRKVEFLIKDAVRELRKLRAGHEMAVRAVSEKKTPFYAAHDPDLTKMLEKVIDEEFPRPGY